MLGTSAQIRSIQASLDAERQNVDQLWKMFGAEHELRTRLEQALVGLDAELAQTKLELERARLQPSAQPASSSGEQTIDLAAH